MYRDEESAAAYVQGAKFVSTKRSHQAEHLKRLFDIVGSALLLVTLLPLMLALFVGVLVTSGAPVLYWQIRLGKGGRKFRFYKFRSMVQDADIRLERLLSSDSCAREEWRLNQKLSNDPRVTRFGRFIRATSLDELPQLWNVLIGDMSLVGPRPCMTHQRELYGEHWDAYISVRPGITGLWQVSGRNNLTYEQRVSLDRQYVNARSLSMDLQILVRTIKVVLSKDGSR